MARRWTVNPDDYPETLRSPRATFVTLEIGGQLRGCIGALAAHQPLVQDVAAHAYAAAFEDPRFPELTGANFRRLDLHLGAVATGTVAVRFRGTSLLAQLRPGVDGLILQFRSHRATFLPAVWESLPDPYVFLSPTQAESRAAAGFLVAGTAGGTLYHRVFRRRRCDRRPENAPSAGARTCLCRPSSLSGRGDWR
jgi:AmmeMemoRadiSam system protein A